MTDLLVHEFKDLSRRNLVQALLDEHDKMFGDGKPQPDKKKKKRFRLSALAGSIGKIKKLGGAHVRD